MADEYRKVDNITIGVTYRKGTRTEPWEELLSALEGEFKARKISTPVGINLTASGDSGIVEFHLKDNPQKDEWYLRGRVGLEAGGAGPTSTFVAGPKMVTREAYTLDPQTIEKDRLYHLGSPGPGRSAASVLGERLVEALYSQQGRRRDVVSYGKALRSGLDQFTNVEPYPAMAKRYGGNTGALIPSDPTVAHLSYTHYVKDTLALARKEGWPAQQVSEMLVVPSQGGVGRIPAEEALSGGYRRATGYSIKETMTSFGDVVYEDQGEYYAGYTGKSKNIAKRVENLANQPIEVAGFEKATGFFQTGPKPLEGQVMTHLVLPGAILGPGEAAANFERFAGKEAAAPWSTRSFLPGTALIRSGAFEPNAWREDPNQAYLSHGAERYGPKGEKKLRVTGYQIEYPLDWTDARIRGHQADLQKAYRKALAVQAIGGQDLRHDIDKLLAEDDVQRMARETNLVDPKEIPHYRGRGTLTGEPQIIARGQTIVPDLIRTNFGVKEEHIKAYGNLMRIGAGAPMDLSSEGPLPQFNVLGVHRAPDWVMSPKNQIKAEPSFALQAFASLPRDYLNRLFSDVGEMERYEITPEEAASVRSSAIFQVSGGYMRPELVNKLIRMASDEVFGHEYSEEEPWGKVRAEQFVGVSPALRGGIQTMLDAGEISGRFIERNNRTYFYAQLQGWLVPKITTVRDLYGGDVTDQTVASGSASAFVDRERFLEKGRPDRRAWNLYHAIAGTMPQDKTISIDDIRNKVDIRALKDEELSAFMKSGPYSENFIDIGGMVLEPGEGAIEVLDSGQMSAYANQWVRTLREAAAIPLGLGAREEAYQLRALRSALTSSEDFVSRLHQRGRIARHVTGTVGMGGPGDAIYIGDDVLSRAFGIENAEELQGLKKALSELGGGPAAGSRPPIGELMTALNLRVRPMEDLYPDDPELVRANRNRIVVPQEVMAMGWGDFDRDPFSFEMQMYRSADKAWKGIPIGNDMAPSRFRKFLAQYAAGTTRKALLSGKEIPWEMLGQAVHETRFTETAKMFQDLREGTQRNFIQATRRALAAVGLGEQAERFEARALGKARMGFGYVPLESLKQYLMTNESQGLRPDASKGQRRAVMQRVSDKMTPFLGIYQNLLDISPFRGRKMMALGTEYAKWLKDTQGKQPASIFWNAPGEMEFADLPKDMINVNKKTGSASYEKAAANYLSFDMAAADAFAEMVIGEEFGHLLGGGSGWRFDLKGSIPIPAEAAATLFDFGEKDKHALELIASKLQSGDEEQVKRWLGANERFWQRKLSQSSKWDIALGHAAMDPLTRGQAGSGTLSQEELMQYSYAAAITKPYMEMLHEIGSVPVMQAAHRAFRSGSMTQELYKKFQRAARSAANLGNDPAAVAKEFVHGLPGAKDYPGGPVAFANELFQRARKTLPANSSTAFAFAAMQQAMVGGLSGLPSGRRLAYALRGKLNEKQWKKLVLGGKSSLTTMNPAEYEASSLLQFPSIPQSLDDVSRWVGTPFMNNLHALTFEAGTPSFTGQAGVNEAKYIRTSLLQKLISELPEDAQQQIASLVGMRAGGRGFAAMAGLKFDELLQEGVNRTQGTVYVDRYPGSSNVYEKSPPSVDAFLSEFTTGRRGIKRDVLEGWYKSLPESEQDILREGVTGALPSMSSYFAGWTARPPEIDADTLASMFAAGADTSMDWDDGYYDEESVEQILAQEAPEPGPAMSSVPPPPEESAPPVQETLAEEATEAPSGPAPSWERYGELTRSFKAEIGSLMERAQQYEAEGATELANRQREVAAGMTQQMEKMARAYGVGQTLAQEVSETGLMTGYRWKPGDEPSFEPRTVWNRFSHRGPMLSGERGLIDPDTLNIDPDTLNDGQAIDRHIEGLAQRKQRPQLEPKDIDKWGISKDPQSAMEWQNAYLMAKQAAKHHLDEQNFDTAIWYMKRSEYYKKEVDRIGRVSASKANQRLIESYEAQRDKHLKEAELCEHQGKTRASRWHRSEADRYAQSIEQTRAVEAENAARMPADQAQREEAAPMEKLANPTSEKPARHVHPPRAHEEPKHKGARSPNMSKRPPKRTDFSPQEVDDINALLSEAATEDRTAGYYYEEERQEEVTVHKARVKAAQERLTGPLGSHIDRARQIEAAQRVRATQTQKRQRLATIDLETGEILPPDAGLGEEAEEAREQRLQQTKAMHTRIADAIHPHLIQAAHLKARVALGKSDDAASYAENLLSAYDSGVSSVEYHAKAGLKNQPGIDALRDIRDLKSVLGTRAKREAQKYLIDRGYTHREASEIITGYYSTRRDALRLPGDTPVEAAEMLQAQAAVEPAVADAVKKFGVSAMAQGGYFATGTGSAPIEVNVKNWKDASDPMTIAVKAGTLAAQQVLTGSATGTGGIQAPPGTPGGGAAGAGVPGGPVPPGAGVPGVGVPGAGVPGGTVPPGAGVAAALAATGGGGGGGASRGGGGGAQETMLGDLGFLLFNIRRVSWLTMESVKRSMEAYAGVEQRAAQVHAMATGEIDRSAPGFRIWESKAAFEQAGLAFGRKAFGIWGGTYSSDVGEMVESAASGPLGGIVAAALPMAGMAGIGNMIGKTFMKRAGPGGPLEQQAGLISGLTTASQMVPMAFAIGGYQNYLAQKSESVGEIVAGTAANIGGTLLMSSMVKGMLASTAAAPYIAPITGGIIALEAISGAAGAIRAVKAKAAQEEAYFGDADTARMKRLGEIQRAFESALQQYELDPTPQNLQIVEELREEYSRVSRSKPVGKEAPVTESTARYEALLKKVGSPGVKWYGTSRALELAAGFESSGMALTGSAADKGLFAHAAEFDFATGLGAEGTMRAGLTYLSKLGIAPWEAQAKTVQGSYFQLLQAQPRGVQDLLASTVGASLGKIGIYGAEADRILTGIRAANPNIGEREAARLARQLSVGTQLDWARMFPDRAFVDVATGLQLGQEESWELQNQIRPLEQAREREKQAFAMQYELPKIQRDTEKSLLQMDLGLISSGLDIAGQRLGIAQQEFQIKYAGAELGFAERRLSLSQLQAMVGYQWQQEDMARSRFQLETQYGWGREDMARAMSHAGTQYEWGQEDIALDWTQLGLQMAWGAEDYQRARRRARGEDRRALDRQRQRNLIQQALQATQLTRKGERMDTQYGWQMEGFGIQGERAGVQHGWQVDQFDIQAERARTQHGWQLETLQIQSEELELQKGKLAEQIPMMEQQLALAKERLDVSDQLYQLQGKYLADEKKYVEELGEQKKRDIEHMNTLLPMQQTLATLAADTEQTNTRNIALWQKAISDMAEMLKADGMDWFFEAFEERYRAMMGAPKLSEAPREADYVNPSALPYVQPNTTVQSAAPVLNITITGFTAYEQAQRFVEAVQNAIQNAF